VREKLGGQTENEEAVQGNGNGNGVMTTVERRGATTIDEQTATTTGIGTTEVAIGTTKPDGLEIDLGRGRR